MCYYEDYPEETELISFDRFGDKGPYGIAPDGLCVFVDSFSMVKVQFGEAWHCKIVKNRLTDRFYFAWPICRVEKKSEQQGEATEQKEQEITNKPGTDDDAIIAEMNDTLFSMRFTGKRYNAYRSINGAYLELIPDAEGNIPCISNRLTIEGLDSFISSETSHPLQYRCKGERLLVMLEQ